MIFTAGQSCHFLFGRMHKLSGRFFSRKHKRFRNLFETFADYVFKMTIYAENDAGGILYDTMLSVERADALRTESMNPGHAGKDKEKNSYGTEKERQ